MHARFLALFVFVSASNADTPLQSTLTRAREEVARGVSYDSSYVVLAYPGGDVGANRGVCTDVIVRGMRGAGIDLQAKVHEDVLHDREAYSAWVKTPDSNIDHRRVGPLMVWFDRHSKKIPLSDTTYLAGDIVVWSFGCKTAGPACYPHHIGFVSDKKGPRGLPLVIHNVGPHPTEDDDLDAWTRVAHYRYF